MITGRGIYTHRQLIFFALIMFPFSFLINYLAHVFGFSYGVMVYYNIAFYALSIKAIIMTILDKFKINKLNSSVAKTLIGNEEMKPYIKELGKAVDLNTMTLFICFMFYNIPKLIINFANVPFDNSEYRFLISISLNALLISTMIASNIIKTHKQVEGV